MKDLLSGVAVLVGVFVFFALQLLLPVTVIAIGVYVALRMLGA